MELVFENQGTHTYLVYRIQPEDTIDSMGLGMLTNNQIAGFAPTTYTQMDANKFIRYNVSAKISVRQFLGGIVNRKHFIGILNGIANAFISAEEYMLDTNSILLDLDYIFADVTTCETFLIYIPIYDSTKEPQDLAMFLKRLLFTTQFDQTENCDYVARIINYLNANTTFSVMDFKQLLDEISGKAASGKAPQPMPQNPNSAGMGQPFAGTNQAAGGSFSYGANQASGGRTATAGSSAAARPMPSGINTPGGQNAGTAQKPQMATPNGGSAPSMAAPAGNAKQSSMAVPGGQSAAASGGQSMAIPGGQSMAIPGGQSMAIPESSKSKKKKKSAASEPQTAPQSAPQQEEKEISWFYLMQHYNKENAAAYKAQKESRKQGKGKEKADTGYAIPGQENAIPGQGNSIPGNIPQGGVPNMQQGGAPNPATNPQNMGSMYMNQQGGAPNPNMGQGANPQNMNPGTQGNMQFGANPQQAAPNMPGAQNGAQAGGMSPNYGNAPAGAPAGEVLFGGTTVLNAGMNDGGTTVLNQKSHQSAGPHLIRKKNSEKVMINKELFRIGKERSYADYFIGDNSAISRSHATIITRGSEYFVTDTNSTNHTFVNGQMIPSGAEVKLNHGDLVCFADEDFEFRLY